MRIDVSFRGLEPSKALREHAVRHLEAQLARCADVVTAVFVRFVARRDVSDADRHCQITVVFAQRSGTATLEAQHPDPLVALESAAARIGRGLAHTRRAAASPPIRLMWTPA